MPILGGNHGLRVYDQTIADLDLGCLRLRRTASPRALFGRADRFDPIVERMRAPAARRAAPPSLPTAFIVADGRLGIRRTSQPESPEAARTVDVVVWQYPCQRLRHSTPEPSNDALGSACGGPCTSGQCGSPLSPWYSPPPAPQRTSGEWRGAWARALPSSAPLQSDIPSALPTPGRPPRDAAATQGRALADDTAG
jgi:hypothetical protein